MHQKIPSILESDEGELKLTVSDEERVQKHVLNFKILKPEEIEPLNETKKDEFSISQILND